MKVLLALAVLCVASVSGRSLRSASSVEEVEDLQFTLPSQQEQQALTSQDDTVISLGGSNTGSYEVTGMLQNFQIDQENVDPINQLLERPGTSYIDASWPNWVDQRLELLDLVQSVMTPLQRPRCAHMQTSLDNGMVSYLASSRFGPAILTTYAQQFEDDGERDFDYRSVQIPTGESLRKSYEDASLLQEMSADADRAFEIAELQSQKLSQQRPSMGYFGANVKSNPDSVMYKNGLDGDSESVQPTILAHPNLLNFVGNKPENIPQQWRNAVEFDALEEEDDDSRFDSTQYAVFFLLLAGCMYVWGSLVVSCIKLCKETNKNAAKQEAAQKAKAELLLPLLPEGCDKTSGIEVASAYVIPGMTKTVVPLAPTV